MDLPSCPPIRSMDSSFTKLKSKVYILAGGQWGRSMNYRFYRLGVHRDAI
jgi:hypothetical protein